jgi:hypothetical protein
VTGVFTLIAGSMAVVIAAISLMGPRTTNLALEDINAAPGPCSRVDREPPALPGPGAR